WVRPPMRPFTLSRSLRSLVARGSIAYSAVTQPLPLPVSQRGTPFVNDAVHSTLVPPKETSALPSACALQPRSIVIGRRSSGVRPSARGLSFMMLLATGEVSKTVAVGMPVAAVFDTSSGGDRDAGGLERLDVRNLRPEEAVGELQ